MVQEYLNEIAPTIYGPNKLKTSRKPLRISGLQPPASGQDKPDTLYFTLGKRPFRLAYSVFKHRESSFEALLPALCPGATSDMIQWLIPCWQRCGLLLAAGRGSVGGENNFIFHARPEHNAGHWAQEKANFQAEKAARSEIL